MMSVYFEFVPQPGVAFDPTAVVASCAEHGAHALLFDTDALPREFFDWAVAWLGSCCTGSRFMGCGWREWCPILLRTRCASRSSCVRPTRGASIGFLRTGRARSCSLRRNELVVGFLALLDWPTGGAVDIPCASS